MMRRGLPPDSLDLACDLQNLGQYYAWSSRPAEAAPLLKRVLDLRVNGLGLKAIGTRETLQTYTTVLRLLNRTAEAEHLEAKAKSGIGKYPAGKPLGSLDGSWEEA